MAGPMDDDDKEKAPLKSKKSTNYSYLRFTNKTTRRVDIVWVNYEGSRVKYKTLIPGQFMDINTFVGHPWIFFDADTGDRMVVKLKEVYEPQAWNSESSAWPPKRKIINITIPVYTLQDCCLQTLRSIVPRNRIKELEITDILKEDLHRLFRNTTLRRQNALTS